MVQDEMVWRLPVGDGNERDNSWEINILRDDGVSDWIDTVFLVFFYVILLAVWISE